MKVRRIVANLHAANPADADRFYRDLLGLQLVMDHGWIRTYAAKDDARVQIGIASEGGNGTPVPDLSIEVDDIDEALRRMRAAGVPAEYGPTEESWGVRRLHVRDPFGKLVNILQHL